MFNGTRSRLLGGQTAHQSVIKMRIQRNIGQANHDMMTISRESEGEVMGRYSEFTTSLNVMRAVSISVCPVVCLGDMSHGKADPAQVWQTRQYQVMTLLSRLTHLSCLIDVQKLLTKSRLIAATLDILWLKWNSVKIFQFWSKHMI